MWRIGSNCFAAVLFILSSTSLKAEDCTDLARVIARESNKFGDSSQIEKLSKANFCSSKYSTATNEQKAQIEASYNLFSGSAAGSSSQIETKQDSECGGKYGTYWSNQITSIEIQKISAIGSDVVRACIQARSFRLTNLVIQNEAISADFRFGGEKDTTINGIIISPPGIAKCTVLKDGEKKRT